MSSPEAESHRSPVLFISHKHTDNRIASVLADFVREKAVGEVAVHLSSNWKHEGPQFGVTLNDQLRQALWNAGVLILLYTVADHDWSFCMWECGAAITPESPDTKVIVFQCGGEVPQQFAGETRVDVRSPDSITRFTKQFLTTPGFFPRHPPIHPHCPDDAIERMSRELFEQLQNVLPQAGQDEEWPAWPFLRIELPKAEIDSLEKAPPAERVALSHRLVKEHAVVVKSDSQAARLFGLTSIRDGQEFSRLLDVWQEAFPTSDATWFDSCCEQIMASARQLNPIIQWTPLRQVRGASDYTPVLSRVRLIPAGGSVHFDIFFYNLSDPQAVPATSRMTPFPEFFYKNLGQVPAEAIKVRDLVREFKARGLDRVLLVTGDLYPIYVIHRSVLGGIILDQMADEDGPAADGDEPPPAEGGAAAAEGEPATGRRSPITEETSLAELLARKEKLFENFVTVRRRATVAEARDSMRMKPNCLDVLVTERGAWDEPVLGWLTKADIDRDIDRIS